MSIDWFKRLKNLHLNLKKVLYVTDHLEVHVSESDFDVLEK